MFGSGFPIAGPCPSLGFAFGQVRPQLRGKPPLASRHAGILIMCRHGLALIEPPSASTIRKTDRLHKCMSARCPRARGLR